MKNTVEQAKGNNNDRKIADFKIKQALDYSLKMGGPMDKEQAAIDRLRLASEMSLKRFKLPLVITTSGGKDSSVCVALAQRAGIPFEVMHNHTTADAPETVYFVRDEFKRLELLGVKCAISPPLYKGAPTSMWDLIRRKMIPPTRMRRYCCEVLKEHGGAGRFIATGVRWEESSSRAENRGAYEVGREIVLMNDNDERRRTIESCQKKGGWVCNPIIDWTDTDVWDYIFIEHIPVNPLYQCGLSRVGCIGCPLANKKARQREFARYPIFRQDYVLAFERMLQERRKRGKLQGDWRMGRTGEDVFHWWMEDGVLPGQIGFDDLEEDKRWND